MEPRGTGVNRFVYWVCNSPLEEWVQLPDLKPRDIINARGMKALFTGNVDNKIFTNPFYFETEKVLLRAQIARISQSTSLTWKGYYRF
jgi:radial spoke head protein 4A